MLRSLGQLFQPDARYTQIPARDGVGHGNIKRSNRSPNCTFFTNWISLEDSITWEIEVVDEGEFEIVIYYTCPQGDEGSVFELTLGESTLTSRILEAHDPPLRGMENDRDERTNSYVKDFKAFTMGKLHLDKGSGKLTLRATEIAGRTVMDVRLIMFERLNTG